MRVPVPKTRLNLGIPGLDKFLAGGLSRGSTVLLKGVPGSGKTTMILQYLLKGIAHHGEPGVLVSFLDDEKVLLENAKEFEWQMKRFKSEGLIRISTMLEPEDETFDNSEKKGKDLVEEIIRMIDDTEAERFALDGLEEFGETFANQKDFKSGLSKLRKALRERGCTALVTSRDGLEVGDLIDGLISLHYESTDIERTRALEIIKMGRTDHADRLIPFEIKDSGIEIIGLREDKTKSEETSETESDKLPKENRTDGESENKELLNNFNEVVLIMDLNGNIKYVNDTVIEKLGHPKSEVIGKNIKDLTPSDSVDMVDQITENSEHGRELVIETAVLDASGSKIPVEVNSKIMTYQGETSILSVARDISERKKTEKREELLHSLLRHDVRNKAQVVQGYLELLKDADLSEKKYQYLEKAERATKDSIDLIEKIRSLRKIGEIEIKEVDIDSILSTVVSENEPQASKRGMELILERCKCKVMGGELLEEVFLNLVENSICHSDGNVVKIHCREREDKVIIKVEDDGRGIPDSEKEEIFNRGFRKGENAGSGLGMYLVKDIVESYEGIVEVKDSELGGARFDVLLQKAK